MSVLRVVLFVWESNESLVVDEKEPSPMRVLQLNMTNSDNLNFNHVGFRLKTERASNWKLLQTRPTDGKNKKQSKAEIDYD